MIVDRWQYLIVLGACLAITLPLETLGPGVYRQPSRAMRAVVPVAAVFVAWDAIAIAGRVWWYDPKYLAGLSLPFDIPVEEVLFFLIIPMCGLLTYNAVETILAATRTMVKRRTARTKDHA